MNSLQRGEILRKFVVKELEARQGGKLFQLGDTDSLIESELADSLFFVDLIIFLEIKFSVKFDSATIGAEDLDSIEKMVALIESRS
jgi:acyl carrier protein